MQRGAERNGLVTCVIAQNQHSHAAMGVTWVLELWIVYLWVRVVSFMQVQYRCLVPGRG
jgi:hypothetical protein